MKIKLHIIFSILFSIFSVCAYAQPVFVSGRVLDEDKEPLIGVVVSIKNTNQATVTDVDGNYSISADSKQTLQYQYIGYDTRDVYIGDKTQIDIILKATTTSLEEVVVVGYGTLRKSDLTGAVSSVSSKALENTDGSSFMSALSGKVAGVQIIQNSGVPGGASTIKIRGSNSMGNSEPLYVIDGVPYDMSSVGGFENEGAAISPLSMINPADIASMEILKDASATAIYGSQASNGVVLITTKSGTEGRAVVNVSGEYGISELTKRIDLLDANQFVIIKNEAQGNTGIAAAKLELAERGMLKTYDWQDILFQTGRQANGNVSMSGGTKTVKYMASLNAYQGDGVVPKTDFSRLSGRLNLNFDVSSRFKMSFNINAATVTTSGLPASTSIGQGDSGQVNSLIGRAIKTDPTRNPAGPGVAIYDPELEDVDEAEYTPLQQVNSITQENNLFQFATNISGEYRFGKSLYFRGSVHLTNRTNNSNFYQNRNIPNGYKIGGWARINDNQYTSFSNDYLLTYNKRFNKNHYMNLVLGSTIRSSQSQYKRISVKNFPNDELLWYALDTGTVHDPTENGHNDESMLSWYGRANYTLMEKYVFTFTGRVDGSSKFSAGNKYGFFPAGAFAWRLNQEKWLKQIKEISNLKLRVSYGITGNQNLGSYASLPMLGGEKVSLGGSDSNLTDIAYSFSSTMPNQDVRWETTHQFNIGVDAGFLKNKIELTMDYYNKNTEDLLVDVNTPTFTGYTHSKMNFGRMQNRGVEFALNVRPINKKRFSWQSSFNLSFNKTTIVELEQDYFPSGQSLPWGQYNTQILIEGELLGTFYGLMRDGIRQKDEELDLMTYGREIEVGEQKYVDINDDGVIDRDDQVVLGNAQPDFIFGFNNTFTLGDFDLAVFIDGQYGNDICNLNAIEGLMFSEKQGFAEVWNRYTDENPSLEYPRVSNQNNSTNFHFSDKHIEDGSFIRLQRVTLGYNLPKKFMTKLKLQKVRFYATAANILTLTNYSGFSPDISFGGSNNLRMGHDSGSYPNPFSLTGGVNITF